MTRGPHDEEFDWLQGPFGDRLDRGDQDEFGNLGDSIIGGRGRPGRAVPPAPPFADWPDAAEQANRLSGGENMNAELLRHEREGTTPELRILVLLTMANAVVAITAVVTDATVAGLLSCTALSVGTIGLAATHLIRIGRRR